MSECHFSYQRLYARFQYGFGALSIVIFPQNSEQGLGGVRNLCQMTKLSYLVVVFKDIFNMNGLFHLEKFDLFNPMFVTVPFLNFEDPCITYPLYASSGGSRQINLRTWGRGVLTPDRNFTLAMIHGCYMIWLR